MDPIQPEPSLSQREWILIITIFILVGTLAIILAFMCRSWYNYPLA